MNRIVHTKYKGHMFFVFVLVLGEMYISWAVTLRLSKHYTQRYPSEKGTILDYVSLSPSDLVFHLKAVPSVDALL